jgi:hypothetical protein
MTVAMLPFRLFCAIRTFEDGLGAVEAGSSWGVGVGVRWGFREGGGLARMHICTHACPIPPPSLLMHGYRCACIGI